LIQENTAAGRASLCRLHPLQIQTRSRIATSLVAPIDCAFDPYLNIMGNATERADPKRHSWTLAEGRLFASDSGESERRRVGAAGPSGGLYGGNRVAKER
jgi:hypothetical protein